MSRPGHTELQSRLRGRAIAISGDLGSGKSSVARALADLLGVPQFSAGEHHRSIASAKNVSTLELNRMAERDAGIDDEVDSALRELALSGEPRIVDSRMAWWFLPNAVAVHLAVSPLVGAERVLARRSTSKVERYRSSEEAFLALRDRAQSERARFRTLYGVDVRVLRNYNLIVDTTSASVEEVVDAIVAMAGLAATEPRAPQGMALSPLNVYPSQPVRALASGRLEADGAPEPPIAVGFSSSACFFVIDGHHRLALARARRDPLIRAELVAEQDEAVVAGIGANHYFETHFRLRDYYDWEAATGVRLAVPEHLRAAVGDDG